MNRRTFIGATLGAALFGGTLRAAGVKGPKAPFQVIYSNDTTNVSGCVSPWHPKGEPFRARYLESSVDEVTGLVDAHFLQPGLGEVPMWPSKIEPLEEHYRWIKETYGQGPDSFGKFVLGGGDVVQVFIDRCQLRKQAAFISFRLNDAHHKEWVNAKPGDKTGTLGMSITRFYQQHPEYRIGPKLGSAQFQVLNWAHPEVPARKLALLTELCENYDLDGLELDFMRFYSFFPRDESTTSEQRRSIIAEFVAKVRAVLDRTARHGKHRWLCVRVPGFLSAHDPMGLDMAALVAAGVEMVNLSASYFTTQQMNVAEIRKSIPDAALYVEMCHSTWNGQKIIKGYDAAPFRRTTPEQYATTAHLAYARGADGVSLFNFAYYREHGGPGRGPFSEPPFDILPQLRDRHALAQRRPQHWFLGPGWENPFAKPKILPRMLASGQSAVFTMNMAPPSGGWSRAARLRIQSTEPLAEEARLVVQWNGRALKPVKDISEPPGNIYPPLLGPPETLAAWMIPQEVLRDGANQMEVSLVGGPDVELAFLEVDAS